jgi:hypothetical protein
VAVEFARFLAVGDYSAHASGSEEGGNACASGANALGKCTLRDEIELNRSVQDHLLEKFVFADVGADVPLQLAVC